MDRLSTSAALADWIARLTGPAVLSTLGVAAIVAALRGFTDSRALSIAAGMLGAATIVGAFRLGVRAIKQLRSGPETPPGEGL